MRKPSKNQTSNQESNINSTHATYRQRRSKPLDRLYPALRRQCLLDCWKMIIPAKKTANTNIIIHVVSSSMVGIIVLFGCGGNQFRHVRFLACISAVDKVHGCNTWRSPDRPTAAFPPPTYRGGLRLPGEQNSQALLVWTPNRIYGKRQMTRNGGIILLDCPDKPTASVNVELQGSNKMEFELDGPAFGRLEVIVTGNQN